MLHAQIRHIYRGLQCVKNGNLPITLVASTIEKCHVAAKDCFLFSFFFQKKLEKGKDLFQIRKFICDYIQRLENNDLCRHYEAPVLSVIIPIQRTSKEIVKPTKARALAPSADLVLSCRRRSALPFQSRSYVRAFASIRRR